MSRLAQLVADACTGLSIQERCPDAQWEAIATHCGDAEIAEIKERIASLKAELATVEKWDGDTQDEIHIAISRFSHLLRLANSGPGYHPPSQSTSV